MNVKTCDGDRTRCSCVAIGHGIQAFALTVVDGFVISKPDGYSKNQLTCWVADAHFSIAESYDRQLYYQKDCFSTQNIPATKK